MYPPRRGNFLLQVRQTCACVSWIGVPASGNRVLHFAHCGDTVVVAAVVPVVAVVVHAAVGEFGGLVVAAHTCALLVREWEIWPMSRRRFAKLESCCGRSVGRQTACKAFGALKQITDFVNFIFCDQLVRRLFLARLTVPWSAASGMAAGRCRQWMLRCRRR